MAEYADEDSGSQASAGDDWEGRPGGGSDSHGPEKNGEKLFNGQDAEEPQAAIVQAEGTQAQEAQAETPPAEGLPKLGVAEFVRRAFADPEGGITTYLQNCIVGVARQNDKRSAYVQFGVDDSVAANLTGFPELCDWYMLFRFPRELVERITKGEK